MRRIHAFPAIPLVLAILIGTAFSEEPEKKDLEDFEKAATEEKKPEIHRGDSAVEELCDSDPGLFFDLCLGTVGSVVLGGVGSWARMEGISDPDLASYFRRRRLGEPVIPMLGITATYQNVDGDVNALDLRGEAGYGPFALQVEHTRYTELYPQADMTLVRIHGLYRMSISNSVELDAGFGSATLRGEETSTGFSFTLPLRAYATAMPLGFEFRPTWSWVGGPTVSEYDMSLVLRRSAVSFRAGYRFVSAGREHLNGPVIGISAQL